MRMPEWIRLALLRRVQAVMDQRPPDFAPGPTGSPFLERWWLRPVSDKGNVWLHRFLQSDQDKVPHDHSFHSISFVLDEGYHEELPRGIVWRPPGAIILRSAKTPHRVLIRGKPAISLFVTGKSFREWGFHTHYGFIPAKSVEGQAEFYEKYYGIKFWKNPDEETKAKF